MGLITAATISNSRKSACPPTTRAPDPSSSDRPADFGEKLIQDYLANNYHKVSDEVQPDWTFEGAAQDAEFLMKVGLHVANAPTWPEWRTGNEFKARRDAMMK